LAVGSLEGNRVSSKDGVFDGDRAGYINTGSFFSGGNSADSSPDDLLLKNTAETNTAARVPISNAAEIPMIAMTSDLIVLFCCRVDRSDISSPTR
jgi:hypothetical protein